MTISKARKNTLRSLRKRDLAEALQNLTASEIEFRKAEMELMVLRDRRKSIRNKLGRNNGKKNLLAGALEQEMLYSQCLTSELGQLDTKETEFSKQLEKASKLVDGLKDAVAKAKKALNSIEDERT